MTLLPSDCDIPLLELGMDVIGITCIVCW